MGVLDVFKKSNEGAVPEVGEEDAFEKAKAARGGNVADKVKEEADASEQPVPVASDSQSETLKGSSSSVAKTSAPATSAKGSGSAASAGAVSAPVASEQSNLQMEKISAKLEELSARDAQFSEQIGHVNETIGELRTMNLENEKKIVDATKEAEKVIDISKQVKPDKLRLDYQKLEMRIQTFEEKLAADKEMVDSVIKEFQELKAGSEAFMGTDALMKLNEDVKKGLVETQKISDKARMYADQVKEIFMDVKTNFAENQKVSSLINNMNESMSVMKEEVEKLKLEHAKVVKKTDYESFQKTFGAKIAVVEALPERIDKLGAEVKSAASFAEDALGATQRNTEDIGNLSLKVGDTTSMKVENYENHLSDVLDILEVMSRQIVEMRKKLGLPIVKLSKPPATPVQAETQNKAAEGEGSAETENSEENSAETRSSGEKSAGILGKVKNLISKREGEQEENKDEPIADRIKDEAEEESAGGTVSVAAEEPFIQNKEQIKRAIAANPPVRARGDDNKEDAVEQTG